MYIDRVDLEGLIYAQLFDVQVTGRMYGQEIEGTIERTRSEPVERFEAREEVLVPRVKSVVINGIQIQFSSIVPENTRTGHCAVPKV